MLQTREWHLEEAQRRLLYVRSRDGVVYPEYATTVALANAHIALAEAMRPVSIDTSATQERSE